MRVYRYRVSTAHSHLAFQQLLTQCAREQDSRLISIDYDLPFLPHEMQRALWAVLHEGQFWCLAHGEEDAAKAFEYACLGVHVPYVVAPHE